jgi:hypothetical protein
LDKEIDMNNATIRKTEVTDYVDFRTDRARTGRALQVVFEDGFEMFLPGSWAKARAIEFIESQMGRVDLKWID